MTGQPGELWIIHNPRSGSSRGARSVGLARDLARKSGWNVTVRPTERMGHATELVREALAAGATRIALAGGDGTVHEAVAGLDGSAVPLGILPTGTGNDFARSLKLPRDVRACVHVLVHGRTHAVDLWRWNGHVFVNVAGVGLDAAVAELVNRKLRRLRGTIAYLVGVGMALPHFRPVSLSLAGDGWEWLGRAMLAAVANAQFYGGGMRIAPEASMDDGQLDVVVVGAVGRFELLAQMPRVFRGTHLRHPAVRTFRTSRLEVRSGPEQPVTLDGELGGGLPAVVERAPKPAQFLVPAGSVPPGEMLGD
jgi:diacylglycerol kinase (ATP)